MGLGLAGILRRTNADKRRAVEIALKEFPKLSSREIAKVCAVSDVFVNKVRPEELQTVSSSETRIGADGKERKMPTPSKRTEPAEESDDEPSKPAPREIVVPFVVQICERLGNRTQTGHRKILAPSPGSKKPRKFLASGALRMARP